MIFFGYPVEQHIIDYRKKTHCFRHATTESIAERKQYSKEEKQFLIDLGIFIAIHIHKHLTPYQ